MTLDIDIMTEKNSLQTMIFAVLILYIDHFDLDISRLRNMYKQENSGSMNAQ